MNKISHSGHVRIIGGKYRGKKISFPAVKGLRPTADRIRETLFNWLMHDIQNACCLDAFAGSGALGLEAYSRGAKYVVFLEQHVQVAKHLQQTIQSFSTQNLKVITASAIDYLHAQKNHPYTSFDIVFLDPPFANLDLYQCIHLFECSDLLVHDGLLYVESPHELELNIQLWRLLKKKKAGKVFYALYQKN